MQSDHRRIIPAFAYRVTSEEKVLIYRDNRIVTILANHRARRFLRQMQQDSVDPQLLMAMYTGNYKRGNERQGKKRRQ